jgi:hypothetical protein
MSKRRQTATLFRLQFLAFSTQEQVILAVITLILAILIMKWLSLMNLRLIRNL